MISADFIVDIRLVEDNQNDAKLGMHWVLVNRVPLEFRSANRATP